MCGCAEVESRDQELARLRAAGLGSGVQRGGASSDLEAQLAEARAACQDLSRQLEKERRENDEVCHPAARFAFVVFVLLAMALTSVTVRRPLTVRVAVNAQKLEQLRVSERRYRLECVSLRKKLDALPGSRPTRSRDTSLSSSRAQRSDSSTRSNTHMQTQRRTTPRASSLEKAYGRSTTPSPGPSSRSRPRAPDNKRPTSSSQSRARLVLGSLEGQAKEYSRSHQAC